MLKRITQFVLYQLTKKKAQKYVKHLKFSLNLDSHTSLSSLLKKPHKRQSSYVTERKKTRQIKTTVVLNRKTKILLYGSNIWSLGEGMMGPILAIFNERVGGDILDVSWIWATYLIATGIFTVFVGNLSDNKISKEKLLVTGYVLNTVFTFSYLFVASSVQLFFVQAGLGFAAALATPTWDALYASNEDETKAGYIWGLAGGRDQLITGVAILLGGLIVNYFDFKVLFITMGFVQAIATIYQAQILKEEVTTRL